MLYRKRKKDISEWIRNGERALLVEGARQVGKTFLIEECLKESKIPYKEINLIARSDFAAALSTACLKGVGPILDLLSYEMRKNSRNEKTIFFIDEVQKCPELVTMIKELVLDGRYRFVLSGSLLGIALEHISSQPVGFLDVMDMYPLDFEEFALNSGMSEETLSLLEECFEKRLPVDDYLHQKTMELFRRYLLVGGMPDAVSKYLSDLDLRGVMNIHRSIKRLYRRDFTQALGEKDSPPLHLERIYEAIPEELSKQNRKFVYASLGKSGRSEDYRDDFFWLTKAGVIIPVYNVESPSLPFSVSASSSAMKVFYNDVGMLVTSYGRGTAMAILSEEENVNEGALFENFVAQELRAHIDADSKLHYFSRRKKGEIDFLISYEGESLPIEVKSGKSYFSHPSLTKMMEVPNYGFSKAYVFHKGNVKTGGNIIYLPIYMVMFLDEERKEFPAIGEISLP